MEQIEKLDKLIKVQFELIGQQRIRIESQDELIKEQRRLIEHLKKELNERIKKWVNTPI